MWFQMPMSTAESTSEIAEELGSSTRAPEEVTATETPMLTTSPHRTTEIVFFTHTRPTTFRDPKCRDMRYSCAFWLQHNPSVCAEQLSFMKAQCAYTCKFCISEIDLAEEALLQRSRS